MVRPLFGVCMALAVLVGHASAQRSTVSIEDAMQPVSLISSQWLRADGDGFIGGRVLMSGVEDVSGQVMLIDATGELTTGDVSADGLFRVKAGSAGVYTLAYRSEQGFAAMAVQLLDGAEGEGFGSQTVLPAGRLDARRAMLTVVRYLPPRIDRTVSVGKPVSSTGVGMIDGAYRVALSADGAIRGRFVQAGSSADGTLSAGASLSVLVMQGGEVIARTRSNYDGRFEVAGLEPGAYDLIAAGMHGYTALGFEAVEANMVAETLPSVGNGERLVSMTMQAGVAGEILVQTAPAGPGVATLGQGSSEDSTGPAPLAPETASPAAFDGGAFNSGIAGGGGGGGGGGFGGGGVFGAAALGAIIWAVTDDDDSGAYVPAPVSP